MVEAADTQVIISTANYPVTTGGILTIRCQVWNFQQDRFKVNLFRVLNTRTEQITSGKDIQSSMGQNVFVATRAFPDGSVVYFLTMMDISDNDKGRYLCKIFDFSRLIYIAEDSMDVQIYSLPPQIYPLCSTIVPNQPIAVSAGDILTLKCTSEKGVPPIVTKWMNTKTARYIATTNKTDGNLVHSESSFLVDSSLQGALFSCEITSSGFPDWKRTCTIGPVTVNSYLLNNKGSSNIPEPDLGNQVIHNSGSIPKLQHNGNCVECTTDDMLQFYLTIAIVGTGLLALIFLATTIILCYKYHHISAVARREPTRVLTPQQSIEPVYVSLQRRSVNADREYMTLEDPNNPDNKIILPKETFDDYCRTMTLKRV